ncbi:hypothetical protein [Amycolatopsis sp. NPDC051903]|uniref:hypothetical protein n=1 Tax=Amycolatopsis sp. NPDC051903 TaxID=3363936 RepID=UPI0037965B68
MGLLHADGPDDTFDQDWYTSGSFTPELKRWVQQHRRPFRVVAGVLETWENGRFLPERVEPAVADLAELVPLVNAVAGR